MIINVAVLVIMLVTMHLRNFTASMSMADLRVYQGTDDIPAKYPYVVCIVTTRDVRRLCTGSLITANWVLTAAHCCVKEAEMIQYGNMSIPLDLSKSKSKIHKMIQHPRYGDYSWTPDDIGLMLVSPVLINKYASISAVDYSVLQGVAVEYAGFGLTILPKRETKGKMTAIELLRFKPLQIGQAVVKPCEDEKGFICVSPKCSITQLTIYGDSGGPLIMVDKIVGLVKGGPKDGYQNTDRTFVPVSPHLTWIQNVITKRTENL